LRPLRENLGELDDLLLNHRRTLDQNTGVPFVRLVYRSEEEPRCQMESTEGERLSDHIAQRAHQELTNRLLAAVERLGEDGVIFLTETAFAYPYLSPSSVLEDCTNCIIPPMALVVFYPGEVDVDKRLLFLGQRPSGYYRTRDLVRPTALIR
jgi:hypothetical protein